MYDLIIRNGTLVTSAAPRQADLAIADGTVAAIGPELEGSAQTEIDAAGLHVFPGLIDAHVHFNEPGRAEWEGFATGTRALAAGGATAFFDMPLNAHPPTLDAASFDQKLSAAQASSLVDFALWGGLTPENLEQLDELAERGVIGFKAFMSNSGIDDFQAVDDLTLYQGMARAAKLGRIVAVHAENDQITGGLARQAIAEGRTIAQEYLRSRPVVAELEAIARAILLAEETGCALHVVHVSTGRGVSMVAAARARGVDVSCETCPHYLVLTEDDLDSLGAVAKCAPPLRPADEQAALWQRLLDGTLPIVASDHSPAPASMKTGDDFFQIWGGISSCQSTLQLLLAEGYGRRRLPLSTIASVTSEFVARRFGLAPEKGRLAIGADADLALVDIGHGFTLQASDLHYRHPHSPYVGRAVRGRIIRTLVRGTTVFQDGEIISGPVGQLIKPHNYF
jgi:allantoinase